MTSKNDDFDKMILIHQWMEWLFPLDFQTKTHNGYPQLSSMFMGPLGCSILNHPAIGLPMATPLDVPCHAPNSAFIVHPQLNDVGRPWPAWIPAGGIMKESINKKTQLFPVFPGFSHQILGFLHHFPPIMEGGSGLVSFHLKTWNQSKEKHALSHQIWGVPVW